MRTNKWLAQSGPFSKRLSASALERHENGATLMTRFVLFETRNERLTSGVHEVTEPDRLVPWTCMRHSSLYQVWLATSSNHLTARWMHDLQLAACSGGRSPLSDLHHVCKRQAVGELSQLGVVDAHLPCGLEAFNARRCADMAKTWPGPR